MRKWARGALTGSLLFLLSGSFNIFLYPQIVFGQSQNEINYEKYGLSIVLPTGWQQLGLQQDWLTFAETDSEGVSAELKIRIFEKTAQIDSLEKAVERIKQQGTQKYQNWENLNEGFIESGNRKGYFYWLNAKLKSNNQNLQNLIYFTESDDYIYIFSFGCLQQEFNKKRYVFKHIIHKITVDNIRQLSTPLITSKLTIENAIQLYENKKYQEAIPLLTQSINYQPQNVDLWYYRSQAYFYLKKYPDAIRDITKAINLKPNDSFYWHTRAEVFEAQKQYAKAISDYNHTLPEAISFGEMVGDYDRAIYILTKRAQAYQKLGQCEKANADFKRACALKASKYSPCDLAWCGEDFSSQQSLEALIVKTANLLKRNGPLIKQKEQNLNQEFRRNGLDREKFKAFEEYKQNNYSVYIYRYAGLIEVYASRYPNDVPRVVRNTKWY
ncbi:MAG: tetratricopeptide repeat protein [Candidatus Sericytochromatia bacterium]